MSSFGLGRTDAASAAARSNINNQQTVVDASTPWVAVDQSTPWVAGNAWEVAINSI